MTYTVTTKDGRQLRVAPDTGIFLTASTCPTDIPTRELAQLVADQVMGLYGSLGHELELKVEEHP